MNFKEYDKIIKEHKFDMLYLIIYYNLKCNDTSKKLSDEDIEKLIHFVYKAYLKDEECIDLGYICDIALKYKDDILKDNFSTWDLLERCYYKGVIQNDI